MSVPQHVVNALSMEAGGTITKYAGCVTDAEGVVIMGANDNDTGFVGVALEAAASGAAVALAGIGSVVYMVVGATGITVNAWLVLHGASGRVYPAGTTSGTAYSIIGKAMNTEDTVGELVSVLIGPFKDMQ
jgi:hypothetical protein